MYEKFGQFIDGKWQQSSGGETYDVINPATEEIIGKASKANSEDIKKALKSAEVYDAPLLAEFGNWHFGYVSAANGNGLGFSLMGAGVVQAFWQGGGNRIQALQGAAIYSYDQHMVRTITSGGFTWGDRSDDPIPIMNGWDYYHE